MTTTRELMTTALRGGTPERTPLSFYSWMCKEDWTTAPEWVRLYELGLGVCHHVHTVEHVEHGVENQYEERQEGADLCRIYRKVTPVGTLRRVTRNGWHHEDWIKTPQDYKARQWIVEHTELVTRYGAYEEGLALVGDWGVPAITGSRTPAMSINVDWAGTEQFCLDVALEVPEMFDLYEAQKKLFLEETRLIAEGPGEFVKWFENLTIDMIGRRRYADLLVSVYNEAVPVLEAGGKRVGVHYDGELRMIADQIAAAPFHMVESLTEPPEGNMLYDECRAAWPDKVLWANVNVDLYYGSEERLRRELAAKRERAGKRGFLFEISEQWPSNWQTSVPIMLDALRELD